MKLAWLIFVVLGSVSFAHLQQDPSGLAIISDTPPLAIDTTGEWAQYELALLNTTSDTIEITRVRGGCACANATVLQRYIAPKDTGYVFLSVSTAHFTSDTNRVSFTFSSPQSSVQGMYVPLTIIRQQAP